jgi:diguanylate cyclase (GGDEF)-like protein
MEPDRRFIWGVEAGTHSTAEQSEPAHGVVRHSCRVLVVDDDVLMRAQLCALLHGSDYEVETATSGEEALRLLRSYPCDIVVTDWQMPVMDGVALCRRVRAMEQHEHVYLLMLTVKSSPQELLMGFAAGADDYVVKGTSSEELIARLEKGRCLARWRATHPSVDGGGDRALLDGATETYNLAYLMQQLPREIARAERHGRFLAVLNCKIDDTVRVDALGTGDDGLVRGFVSCATACIRKSDWLARSGVREFMIVLPETDERGARFVARKLSEAFARQALSATGPPRRSALQFSVTAMDTTNNEGSAAYMRALLRKTESLRKSAKHDERRSGDTGTVHYLSDLESNRESEKGRNWPAT